MVPAEFKDHFSRQAGHYSRFRPGYPPELFDALAAMCPDREAAWDCATGTGQAALGLAERFGVVLATDASAEQVASAAPHPRVRYSVAPAEASGLPDAGVGLVAVAQAAHWFNLPAFYAEARRVARPGALLALWTYTNCRATPELDREVLRFYHEVVGAHWPPERRWVEEGYATLPFPFEEEPAPDLAIRAELTLEEFLGYLRTWSATQRCQEATGRDPVEANRGALERAWGGAERLEVEWPLRFRLGRL